MIRNDMFRFSKPKSTRHIEDGSFERHLRQHTIETGLSVRGDQGELMRAGGVGVADFARVQGGPQAIAGDLGALIKSVRNGGRVES